MIHALALVASLRTQEVYQAPAGTRFTVVGPESSVLPNGRLLSTAGRRLYGSENVWNVALSPGERAVAVAHERGVTLYDGAFPGPAVRKEIPRKDFGFALAFLAKGSKLLLSSGEAGGLQVVDLAGDAKPVDISGGEIGSYVNDFVVSADERYCYAVDVARQDLLVFDLRQQRLVSRTRAGREPYAVALDSSNNRVFVANIGMFDYAPVPKTTHPDFFAGGLTRPAFPFPSPEAEKGVEFEGRFVPGIGTPYSPSAHSVYAFDVTRPEAPLKVAEAKTGLMVHAPTEAGKAVGGSAPCAVLVHRGHLFVSNSNNDTVQQFNAKTLKLERTIRLAPAPGMAAYRGVIPNGMAMDPAGKTLYVCESGINAVAAIEVATGKVQYHMPTGWYPSALKVAGGGTKLVVACQKGIGRGPQGAKSQRLASDERHGMVPMPGMAHVLDVPSGAASRRRATQTVLGNNGLVPVRVPLTPNPVPLTPGQASEQIKHVVFITKENHTFDGIFGTLEGAKAEPSYAEWGEKGWLREKKDKAERVAVMPNHLKLARQFAISDNFYMEPAASGDGHRWLVGNYPSVWTTKVFYSGWNFALDPAQPGRLVSFTSNGSQIPEDYLENGSMWEHLERGGVKFRNYGEGWEFAAGDEAYETTRTGVINPVNFPINRALWDNTCWEFPIYNNNIPDVARFEWFKEDLENNFRKMGKPIPQFMNITYCNDHGSGPMPKDGYPYTASFMADNDLALGRTLEYLSSLHEWKSMAVFVTQDDSGGDDDHVDRHRSFVLALGPWAKKRYVSHEHTSIMSILKTIYLIFGMGPNNLFDATATDLRDMFTMTPDFAPYGAVDADPRVFVASQAYDPTNPEFKKRRFMKPSVAMDDPRWIRKLEQEKVGG